MLDVVAPARIVALPKRMVVSLGGELLAQCVVEVDAELHHARLQPEVSHVVVVVAEVQQQQQQQQLLPKGEIGKDSACGCALWRLVVHHHAALQAAAAFECDVVAPSAGADAFECDVVGPAAAAFECDV